MNRLIFPVLLSFLLLYHSTTATAQKISQQKGLTTASFTTAEGTIRVYLPEDIRQGDVISGTVVAEPEGDNERQRDRNLLILVRHAVSLGGKRFELNRAGRSTPLPAVTMSAPGCDLALLPENSSSPLQQLSVPPIPVQQQRPAPLHCVIPGHVLTGSPMNVPGRFDGNAANSQCTIQGQPATILAESPRNCVVAFPQEANGMQLAELSDTGDDPCIQQVSAVQMNVSAGKLNLRRGEQTHINVDITGLQNLPDTALLSLVNITPNVVILQPSNTIVIPLLPSQVSGGNFSRQFNVQSTQTGGFAVNVNLDLPAGDIMLTPGPGDGGNKCACNITAELVQRSVNNPRHTYFAIIKKSCTGPDCSEGSIVKKWEIVEGQENGDILDNNHGKSIVSVQEKAAGTFIVKFTATLTCSDGSTCNTTAFMNEKGDPVPGPAEENTEEEPGSTTPTEPQNPVQPGSSKCGCNGGCEIKKKSDNGTVAEFEVTVKVACTGTYGTGSTRSVCEAGKPVYQWKIGESGKDVAEITGSSKGSTVKVKLKKPGQYTLYVYGTYTCTDGTVCEFGCNAELTVPPTGFEKACIPTLAHRVIPMMDGGLVNKYIGIKNEKTIRRDDFIVLEAAGADYDLAVETCEKLLNCPDDGCEKTTPIAGKVRFEWELVSPMGETGSFVQIGCIPDANRFKGEHVIFKPPYVPLPVTIDDTTVTATINLYTIDAGSPVADPVVTKTVTVNVTRHRLNPDIYTIAVSGGEYAPAGPGGPSKPGCACKPDGPQWQAGDNLSKPDIILPAASSSNNKLVQGQWMILSTKDQLDKDLAIYKCISASSCPTQVIEKSYDDVVRWKWKAEGGGRIILSDSAQFVVYEAPLSLGDKDSLDITITVSVHNPPGLRRDPLKSFTATKLLRIYKPGIRMHYAADTSWVPEWNNKSELRSELVYKSGKEWKPGFDHMCRVHFFELLNVSQEKGICLNYPAREKADDCFDLQLKQEKNLEVFAAALQPENRCTLKDQYMEARSGPPLREFSISVHSLDYGSWGYLRSFANISKGSDKFPVYYYPVPWLKTEAMHPLHKEKKPKKEYKDNRVTIPYDTDENHIPDKGWKISVVTGKDAVPGMTTYMPDYESDLKLDLDNKPIGDGFAGDGLSLFEEYRGFMVAKPAEGHHRTNPAVKDLFVYNRDDLPVNEFIRITEIPLHQISETQYSALEEKDFRPISRRVSNNQRFINFNFGADHVTHQKGLYLVDEALAEKGLLGYTPSEVDEADDDPIPAPPNWNVAVKVDKAKTIKYCTDNPGDLLTVETKLPQIVAHELCHAINIYHHGEKKHTIGLTSGNKKCIMRYDNYGRTDEAPGTLLCDKIDGANESRRRGNCVHQIRISGRMPPSGTNVYPKRM